MQIFLVALTTSEFRRDLDDKCQMMSRVSLGFVLAADRADADEQAAVLRNNQARALDTTYEVVGPSELLDLGVFPA